MTAASILRKAKPVNVREAQARLSQLIKSKSPSMVLSHGKPVSFLLPYEDMLYLLDTLQELKDTTLQEIARARDEYASGKEVPAERLFRKRGVPYRVSRASRRPAP
jgi:antitoxin (DNA-binding transcriptional repressor) of toxin-antitoxin stability system